MTGPTSSYRTLLLPSLRRDLADPVHTARDVKRFGDARIEQARASQLESRTAVIAILAALADLPWDQQLKW